MSTVGHIADDAYETLEDTALVDARTVDDAARKLRELRRDEREGFGVAAAAVALALAATELRPDLAMPLFLGGLFVGARAVRALWRHWDLLDRLAGERDAYVIPEVRARASSEATLERRRSFAALIRSGLRNAGADDAFAPGLAAELEALASELDDGNLDLDPACAVACLRLLSDPAESPLLNPGLPTELLRSRVHQIRLGFHPGGKDGHEPPSARSEASFRAATRT